MKHLLQWYAFFGLGLFASILAAMEIGRWSGTRVRKHDADGATTGVHVVDGAIFALMGLMIGFTFSGANSRFDEQRELIIHESDDIGTAYLRINLLPDEAQPVLRQNFCKYVDVILAIHRKLPDVEAARAEIDQLETVKHDIWTEAVAGSLKTGDPAVESLVLGSLNAMFDTGHMRMEQTRIHPPMIIHTLLIILVLLCSLLAGSLMAGNERPNWVHIFGFAIMLTLTVLIIVDLEYPRLGAIRIDSWDRVLMDVRTNMK